MFDFFGEIADNTSQTVTVINWCLDSIKLFLTNVGESASWNTFLHTVSLFPAPLTALIMSYLSVSVFDFVRGR